MKDNKRNIDEFFQEELGQMTEMPPAAVWESLEKRLDTNKPNSKKIAWWILPLVAALLITGTISAYQFLTKNNTDSFTTTKTLNNQESITAKSLENSKSNPIEKTLSHSKNDDVNKEISSNNESNSSQQKVNVPIDDHKPVYVNESNKRHSTAASSIVKSNVHKALNTKTNTNTTNRALDKVELNKANKEAVIPESIKDSSIQNSVKANLLTPNNKTKETIATDKKSSSIQTVSKNKKSTTEKATTQTSRVKIEKAENEVYPDEKNNIASVKNTKTDNNSAPKFKLEPNKNKASEQEKNTAQTLNKPTKNAILGSKNNYSANAIASKPKEIAVASKEKDANKNLPQPENAAGSEPTPNKNLTKTRKSINMNIGVKAGYERGANSYTASKYVGTIFAEVNFSKRLSFVFQPSVKLAQANQVFSKTTGNYFKANGVTINRFHVSEDSMGNPIGYDYAYTQSYDSMIASVVMQKKYVEFELPFLFKYQLDKHFSLFGGMSFTFGKVVGLSNSLQTLSGLKFIDTVLNSKDSFVGTVPLKYEHPNTLNISKYKPTEEKSVSPIRFGYTIGVSYLINRVVVDLSIQQNLSRLNSISDADIRKLYTQPYYRLSLGYNMFTNRKK